MQFKVLVLDIDGTLRAPGQERVSAAVAKAVQAVQAAGVKLAIATGRTRAAVPPRMLRGLRPDYYVCANGAQVVDRAGKTLFSKLLTSEEMYALVDWCEDYSYPLAFAFPDGCWGYVEARALMEGYANTAGGREVPFFDGEDQDRHLSGLPFAAFGLLPTEGVQGFSEKYGHLGLRFLRFAHQYCDIVQDGMDKSVGLARLLHALSIDSQEMAAVGDGVNDIGMLALAGCGVAMASAPPSVQAAAQRLGPSAAEDGVAAVCRELFPEAFL